MLVTIVPSGRCSKVSRCQTAELTSRETTAYGVGGDKTDEPVTAGVEVCPRVRQISIIKFRAIRDALGIWLRTQYPCPSSQTLQFSFMARLHLFCLICPSLI